METRASHVLIGGITLAITGLLFVFILWLVKAEIDDEFATYDILFDGAISGLGSASVVQYKGVKVGEISTIEIFENDTSKIRVEVRVQAITPVYADTVAKIEYQGVTGVGFVQLSGGTAEAGKAPKPKGHENPVIKSEHSDLAVLMESAPEIMSQVLLILQEVRGFMSKENVERVGSMLANVDTILSSVAVRGDDIGAFITNVSALSEDLRKAVSSLNKTAANIESISGGAEEMVSNDLQQLVEQLKGAVNSYTALADQLSLTVEAARPGLQDFSGQGLRDISLLVEELRSLDRKSVV